MSNRKPNRGYGKRVPGFGTPFLEDTIAKAAASHSKPLALQTIAELYETSPQLIQQHAKSGARKLSRRIELLVTNLGYQATFEHLERVFHQLDEERRLKQ